MTNVDYCNKFGPFLNFRKPKSSQIIGSGISLQPVPDAGVLLKKPTSILVFELSDELRSNRIRTAFLQPEGNIRNSLYNWRERYCWVFLTKNLLTIPMKLRSRKKPSHSMILTNRQYNWCFKWLTKGWITTRDQT